MNTTSDQERAGEARPFAAGEIESAINDSLRRLATLGKDQRDAKLSEYEANGLPVQMRGLAFVVHIDRLRDHARRVMGLPEP